MIEGIYLLDVYRFILKNVGECTKPVKKNNMYVVKLLNAQGKVCVVDKYFVYMHKQLNGYEKHLNQELSEAWREFVYDSLSEDKKYGEKWVEEYTKGFETITSCKADTSKPE